MTGRPEPIRARSGTANYLIYRGAAAVAAAAPEALATAAGRLSGLVVSKLARRVRPVVAANLRRVLGPDASEAALEAAVDGAFQSYAEYWVESARLVSLRPKEVFRRFTIEGFDVVEEAMGKGTGVILALPHLGAWDFGGLWLTLKGYPMTTIVEPVEPPELFEWFRSQREMLGLTIHTLGPEAPGLVASALRRGRLVGLVADRDIAGNGVKVEFFGEPTTLPGGAAVLALRTGAPLFPCAVYQGAGRRRHAVVRPPLVIERSGKLRHDVAEMTQLLAHEFEGLIEKAPAQWHMFQPNWPADREKWS